MCVVARDSPVDLETAQIGNLGTQKLSYPILTRPTRPKFYVARLPQFQNGPLSRIRVARFMHRANSRGARDGFGSCFKIRGIWGWRFSHGKYTGRVRVAEVGTGTIAAYRTLI